MKALLLWFCLQWGPWSAGMLLALPPESALQQALAEIQSELPKQANHDQNMRQLIQKILKLSSEFKHLSQTSTYGQLRLYHARALSQSHSVAEKHQKVWHILSNQFQHIGQEPWQSKHSHFSIQACELLVWHQPDRARFLFEKIPEAQLNSLDAKWRQRYQQLKTLLFPRSAADNKILVETKPPEMEAMEASEIRNPITRVPSDRKSEAPRFRQALPTNKQNSVIRKSDHQTIGNSETPTIGDRTSEPALSVDKADQTPNIIEEIDFLRHIKHFPNLSGLEQTQWRDHIEKHLSHNRPPSENLKQSVEMLANYYRRSRPEEQVDLLKQLLAKLPAQDPDRARLSWHLALICRQQGWQKEAQYWFDEWEKLKPHDQRKLMLKALKQTPS